MDSLSLLKSKKYFKHARVSRREVAGEAYKIQGMLCS